MLRWFGIDFCTPSSSEVTTNAKENNSLQGVGKTIKVKAAQQDATIKLLKKIYLEFKELE
jgi:hypothetical protein